jgi:hypothetical protein
MKNETSITNIFRPFSNPNPLRGCNSDLAQHSNTPTLRAAGFEDEDENENEAPCEHPPITNSTHQMLAQGRLLTSYKDSA